MGEPMDDLVKRLRGAAIGLCTENPHDYMARGISAGDCIAAADAIEASARLIAEKDVEIARLREERANAREKALEEAAKLADDASERSDWPTSRWLEDLADAIRDLIEKEQSDG